MKTKRKAVIGEYVRLTDKILTRLRPYDLEQGLDLLVKQKEVGYCVNTHATQIEVQFENVVVLVYHNEYEILKKVITWEVVKR